MGQADKIFNQEEQAKKAKRKSFSFTIHEDNLRNSDLFNAYVVPGELQMMKMSNEGIGNKAFLDFLQPINIKVLYNQF